MSTGINVSEDQVALVLNAVAEMEGWDAAHESIEQESTRGWKFRHVNGQNMPAPSGALMKAVRKLTSSAGSLAATVLAQIGRGTGRRYEIKLELLDANSLRELQRLLRDLDDEKRAAARKAQLTPWRRP